MIKKVKVEELSLGMFIQDLNCDWMGHTFLRRRFLLHRHDDLERIVAAGIRELYIDTDRGRDVPEAPTEGEVRVEVQAHLVRVSQSAPPLAERTTHWEELAHAEAIRHEATEVVTSLLNDVRLGRAVDAERLEPQVTRLADSVLRNPGTLVSLSRLKHKDTYTFQHCVSTSALLMTFGRAMGLPKEDLVEAGIGAMLHDIGKMQVPQSVLNKPGSLTETEFHLMKEHVLLGVGILEHTPGITARMVQIASEHHERFDGTGYPDQLRGFEISELGRMTAIVDVYDALTSHRVYRTPMEPSEALRKLYEWSAHHFDAPLVERFIQTVGIYPVGSLVRLESGRLAVVVDLGEGGPLTPRVRIIHDIRRDRRLTPWDLDLAGGKDRILEAEEPGPWGISPGDYLLREVMS